MDDALRKAFAAYSSAAGDSEDLPFQPVLPGEGNRRMGAEGVKEDEEREEVTPTPCFVIKTVADIPSKDANQKQLKVFVNVCSSENVGNFHKKKQIGPDGKEQEVGES